jgi:hypothetical protein
MFGRLIHALLGAVAGATCLFAASQATADVITFEGLVPAGSPGVQISNGYAGLNWNNFYAADATHSDFTSPASACPCGFPNGLVSGSGVGFNGGGLDASFSSASQFTLSSLYVTAGWSENLSLQIQGYANSSFVIGLTTTIGTSGPSLLLLNWAGIDTVMFHSYGGNDPLEGGNPDGPSS